MPSRRSNAGEESLRGIPSRTLKPTLLQSMVLTGGGGNAMLLRVGGFHEERNFKGKVCNLKNSDDCGRARLRMKVVSSQYPDFLGAASEVNRRGNDRVLDP